MHKQVEKLDEQNRHYRAEVSQNARNESRYRFKYKDTSDKLSMMTIELKTLKDKVATFDAQKLEHKAQVTDLNG